MALTPCHAQNIDTHGTRITMHIDTCNFSLMDVFHGLIIEPTADNGFKYAGYEAKVHLNGGVKSFGFEMTCRGRFANKNQVAIEFGARFDAKERKWVPDFGDASEDEISDLKDVTKTFPLDSRNSSGFYTIQDDQDGEPSRRMRHISYCLFHETKAICGDGQVKRLVDAKSDMLPYALKILRSVEFSDTSAEAGKGINP
ncbi:hypothetical protein ACFQI9_37465 [Paraburkholderia dipogonis]